MKSKKLLILVLLALFSCLVQRQKKKLAGRTKEGQKPAIHRRRKRTAGKKKKHKMKARL